MRLLVITQKVDRQDSVLGFMHQWLKAFASHYQKITVICLQKGAVDLPGITVYSLGKEKNQLNGSLKNTIIKKIVIKISYLFNFYRLIWKLRNEYDAVFVHMNQVYVLLGWPIWFILGKKIGLWYAHGHTPVTLRMAAKMSHIIFTSTALGFRLKSNKLKIIGQGVDVDFFKEAASMRKSLQALPNRVVCISRISPVKNIEAMIMAADEVRKKGIALTFEVYGSIVKPEHQAYFDSLKLLVEQKNLQSIFLFKGAIPYHTINQVLAGVLVFVNPSKTGSLDKAGIEAMAAGVPVISCNESYLEFLKHYSFLQFSSEDFRQLADDLEKLATMPFPAWLKLGDEMRDLIVSNHSLYSFSKKIATAYESK